MNRRGFLSALIGSGLSAAVDPEKLLWTPGQRTIFIPPARNVLTPQWYTQQLLLAMKLNLKVYQTACDRWTSELLSRPPVTIRAALPSHRMVRSDARTSEPD
jgi:hypothetical protein